MIDGVFSAAVQEALSLELPGVYVGEPQDDQPIPAKSVLMELQTDVVVGSPLQRGTLTLNVLSQADDYSKADQAEFTAEVDAAMRALVLNQPTISARNAIGVLRFLTSWALAPNHKKQCLYLLEQ